MGLIGSPGYTYDENIEPWGKAAPGWVHRAITDIAIDRQDKVYVYIRGEPWVMVFDSNGGLLRTWGDGYFKTPHGITTGIDGSVFCIDTVDQTIRKFTPEGELLMTLGESSRASGFLRASESQGLRASELQGLRASGSQGLRASGPEGLRVSGP